MSNGAQTKVPQRSKLLSTLNSIYDNRVMLLLGVFLIMFWSTAWTVARKIAEL